MREFKNQIALNHKYPDLLFGRDYKLFNDDSDEKRIFEWITKEVPKPSFSDLKKWYEEWENLQYQRNRKMEFDSKYPIADQMDYIFHHGVERWKTDIVQPIKNKFPKGE